MSAEAPDALTLIVAVGSAALSALLGIVVSLVGSRAKHLETKVDSLEKQLNNQWVKQTELEGRARTSEAEIAALKKDTLTREIFEERTNEQNRQLDKLDAKVGKIDRELVSRPTRSEMSLPAARPLVGPRDIPRQDSDPVPPMRGRMPSRRE